MADPAVTFLLGNLKQLMEYYADLILGAENELEKLEKELDSLKAFLKDAAKMSKKAEFFKVTENQIREAVYSAEDTIDSCLIQLAAEKAAGNTLSCTIFSTKRVSLAEEVKSLRENIIKPACDLAWKTFANLRIDDRSRKSAEDTWTVAKAPNREDDIVGFRDQEEVLIGYLMEKKDELDVITIVGMPGLGKTTLASKIFNNEGIKCVFDHHIWIEVSQHFSLNNLFQRILDAIAKTKDISNLSHIQTLDAKVRNCLEGVKFLLVLDDIWSIKAWNDIQCALPKKNNLGKVLITSRENKVGMHANVNRKPHMLRMLTEDESWELLQLEVFGKQKRCPPEFQHIGKYIAARCGGLPLNLVVLKGILLNENVEAWKKVAENVRQYFKSDVVLLSYMAMPKELRDCFLYLGIFPEDYEVPAKTLFRLWMAEGFIHHKEGQSLEETAEENLDELINMNLVKVVKIHRSTRKVKTCRVHDVIRHFCITKAAIEEQNLFKEIKVTKGQVFDPPLPDKLKYRRLCIHFHLAKFLSEKKEGLGVRSFLCFYREACTLDPNHISSITESFKLLRVLDVMSTKFTIFPTKVNKLIHLRYITLSFEDLDVVPKSISELRFLQTLIVNTTKRTLKIEANIWNMSQLRHLVTKASIILVGQREGNGACENLQTLSRLSPEYCTNAVLQKARNLKKLGIRGPLETKLDPKTLEKLDHLENLKLLNDLFSGAASENALHRLPHHGSFPKRLKKLTLSATYLDWEDMSTLGKIETLQVLKLKENAFHGIFWKAVGCGFSCLEFLLIESTDLVDWEISDNDFRSLTCLVLNCEKLSEVPLDLAQSLRELDIQRVAESAAESVRKIKEIIQWK
ncbi:hypothetical protein BUALT_Bualt07G0018000 [Buddleja alternifolia]|uniref:Uncharacterized protein n=1 Tax=Buddleja alternifolia TaxID=168488 RepID=A0AAV6XF57_9LAMI|nr:hypothetical protein BUALT_Bualt07G0018000 [Buddleja alternifolia]